MSVSLELSSAARFRQGLASGLLISEKAPENSKLLEVLRYQGAIKMPQMGKLRDQRLQTSLHG